MGKEALIRWTNTLPAQNIDFRERIVTTDTGIVQRTYFCLQENPTAVFNNPYTRSEEGSTNAGE